MAGLATNTGQLEFFNVDDMNSHRSQQHFMCTDVAWDFTGRYVCTYVDVNRDMEHGYIIWSFTGDMLYRCALHTAKDFDVYGKLISFSNNRCRSQWKA